MKNLITFSLLLVCASTLTAAESVRVLLPVYFEQPVAGAYGSIWNCRFAVHNSSSGHYTMQGCDPSAGSGCTLILPGDEDLVPNETQTALPARYPKPENPVSGAVLYLGSDAASANDVADLSFQLRVADLSRSATDAGTEIPVIRDSAFRTSTTEILDVPADPRFRIALRLFEMNLDRADFVVRVFDAATGTSLDEREVTTFTGPQPLYRFHPGFVELADLTNGLAAATFIRVEIEPMTVGAAFWAYATVTNNDTQRITLATPQ